MNLKDRLIKLFEENGASVEKLKGRQRTLYKINGNILYITYKERIGEEKGSENYYLQVNKNLVMDTLSKYDNLTILIICGTLSQILVIDAKEFLKLTQKAKVYRDGNIKFNVLVTKKRADFQIRITGLGIIDINRYVNAFDKCILTNKVREILTKIQEETEQEIIPTERKIEIPQIKIIRKEKITFDEEKVRELLISGEGDRLEKFILTLFEFWGFEIDKDLSGKSGELDVICTSPIPIGIECRSTKQHAGVNIVDELNRHIRRYERRSGLSNFIGLIICDSPTSQLVEDVKTERRFLMDSEALIKLIKFTFNYPLSPIEFRYFFRDYGNIKANVKSYLGQKLEKIKLREAIVSIFQRTNEILSYADIKAHLNIMDFKISDDELREALIELSSPLINWLEKEDEGYRLIWKEEFWQDFSRTLKEVMTWLH